MKAGLLALPGILFCFSAAAQAQESGTGAVRGEVRDAQTHEPVAGARVYLLNTKLCKISGAKLSVRTAKGDFLLPHFQTADFKADADGQGRFALQGVAAGEPFKSYTVFIRAPGYADFVIHNARVYPSRPMTIAARLRKTGQHAAWFEGTDASAPVAYEPAKH